MIQIMFEYSDLFLHITTFTYVAAWGPLEATWTEKLHWIWLYVEIRKIDQKNKTHIISKPS